jgi:hypothetical protein
VNLRPIWSENQQKVTDFSVTWRWDIQCQLQDFYVDPAVRDVSLKLQQGTPGIRAEMSLLRKLPGAEKIH